VEAFAPYASEPVATLPAELLSPQTVTPYRIATAAYATGPADDPAHTLWYPRIPGDLEISQSGVDALGIGGRMALGIAEIDVWDADDALSQMARYGTADGRAATVRVVDVRDTRLGDFGTNYGATQIAFRGVVQRIEHHAHHRARITVTDAAERLATPLQPARYAGTGGLEGDADLAGRPKPVLIGRRFNVPPVYLGNVDLGDGALPTYAIHWRAVQAIDAVRIRGVQQVEVTGTAPTVGEYRAWEADGVFQIGSNPDGDVTADALGDALPGYVSTTAGVVRRLVQSLGPALADEQLQLGTFDLAEADIPGAIGYWRGADEVTAGAAIEDIVAGCGAILCGGRDGSLRLVDPLAAGNAQFGLSEGNILACEPIPMPAALRPSPSTVAIDWRPNAAPLTDMAGIVDAERAALSSEALGPARAFSATITGRVAQVRDLRLRGLYYDEADALARAERWRVFFEHGPRAFRLTTDRYLGQMDIGALGAIAYRAYGLGDGVGVTVLAFREMLAGRRLTIDVVTSPFVVVPPLVRFGGVGVGEFILDLDAVV
jgi:hypothetical protein